MKIRLGSRIHRYMKRLSIFLIIVALVVGIAGCESTCAPLQYVLSVLSTLGGTVTIVGEGNSPYPSGAVVTLVAVAYECYEFVNWTGDNVADPNSATTTVTIDEAKSVTANFALLSYNLTAASTDGGEVTTPGEGTFTYDCGTVFDLVATPDAGYRFVNWTGDVDTIADVYAASTTITMKGDYSITAEFAWQYDLSISSTEGGEVTEPGEGVFPCDEGSVVDLVAEAEEGYRFINWTGDVSTIADDEDATTTITMEGDYSITANFEQIPPGQFTLTISSTAGGSVTNPGNGIFVYDKGATVNLTAEANEGYQFLNWTGDVGTIADDEDATTNITMNGDYSITANFEQTPPGQFTLTIFSTAGGSVITPGNGIFACDAGDTVNLTAEADEGYQFLKWTGNVSTISDVNAATTTITMNDDYTITANFALPIWDWYDLDAIRDNLGGSYVLMNDLDSTTAGYTELASKIANGRKGWQPIGTTAENDKFAGSFDGQGHEICDLFINRPTKPDVGLFGVVGGGGVIENVGLMNVTVIGYSGVGGLAGHNSGNITNSYCTGRVTGGWRVGGLVGWNEGAVNNSYSTGRVTGGWWVGGLAGHNSGYVSNSYSTGSVTGGWWVGGLVGWNEGPVTDSYSTGRVTGYGSVGGLVGWNEGPVNNSYSSGSVTGNTRVGGLAGHNNGNISNSYCTGIVTGNSHVGGLVGWNEDTVTDSYSTGSVTGNTHVGGLVGWNRGTVTDSYSIGSVAGNTHVGGLVGKNEGAVNNSYSTGRVTGNKHVGGLVGSNAGTVSNSFWDTQTSGQATSSGGTGKTPEDMMDFDTFDGVGWDITAVNLGETDDAYTWNIVDTVTYPFLSWESVV